MLRAVASGAAQVREAALLAREAGVVSLADDGRPRAVVVCGMGGSGIAGDVLAAVCGPGAPVPVLTHRGYGLPGWVGAADLVVAVSCSGSTEETLSALEEAVRRGSRLLVVGAADSPLQALGERGRAVFVPVTQGRQPRATVWALSTPLVVAADALGLVQAGEDVIEATAVQLEQVALRCRPDADHYVNAGKQLALDLSGALPVTWGTSPLAGVAAYRFACQLNENGKTPGVWGVLPEANHNQVVAFDGPFAGRGAGDDFFRDRTDDDTGMRMRLVLLRDTEEHPQVTRRADVSRQLAEDRGIGVSVLQAEGMSTFERLASLVGLGDWTSTYLALLEGNDPTPVDAITELKQRIRR
ncbi:MAG: bifunctional phosphoglucose/phosphomannose isomerase [Actinobacteria bacterium]|nr:bifunctional phosphoglucose/phosphomannose isomerase [Actinomycetota bacterium]MCA1722430.1 bifunctional phosphoglucose/phosphomannose isomerase [Actinomycetota bacterium]